MEKNPESMGNIKKLLIDADAFVALNDKKDSNYQKAIKISEFITISKTALFTSDPAFGEAITVISENVGLKKAVEFAEEVLKSKIEIVEVDSKLRRDALEIFKKQRSKNTRFTDCVNMAVLNNKGLKEIFSFDSDYKKNGILRIGIDKPINPTKID